MDLIELSIPASFVGERTRLSWREVRLGLDQQLLCPHAPIGLARDALSCSRGARRCVLPLTVGRGGVVAIATVSVLLGCVAGEPPRSEAPIVGGAVDEGDEAVVFVVSSLGPCTGTLVSPHVVLTALHCIADLDTDELVDPATVFVGVGSHFSLLPSDWPAAYRASRLVTPPGAGWRGRDVGLIVLADAIPDVEPIPVRRDAPADRIGATFVAIGFGRTPDDPEFGTKRIAVTSAITGLTETEVVTEPTVCEGDSGGPMLEQSAPRRVIGVASNTAVGASGEACPGREDRYARVDLWIGLLDRTIVEAGDCASTGAESCDGLDGDCDGTVDEGCVAPGGACRADSDCAFAQLPDGFDPTPRPFVCGEGGTCTRPCDPVAGTADQCSRIAHPYSREESEWDGARCVPEGDGCTGWCEASAPGLLGEGTACASDAECASSRCADPGDGRRRCVTSCVGDAARCPFGEVCVAGAGACGACVDAALLGAPRGLGEPRRSDAECVSGSCAADDVHPFCTRACATDAECGDALHCASGRCARGSRQPVGGTCTTTEDCAPGAVCARAGGDSWCTSACETDASCPEGFACGSTGGTRVCVPARATLGAACDRDQSCATGLCRGGTCTTDCTTGARCAPGTFCVRDPTRTTASCRRSPPASTGSTGCAVGFAAGPDRLCVWAVVLAALARLARRRAPRCAAPSGSREAGPRR